MIRLCLIVTALFFADAARAEPIRVSAGEQADFTRIVLEFPEVPQWQARRRGNSYRVSFSSVSPLNFDLSRVFRLIDRSRVADLRAIGGNALEIDLACNCDVRLSQSGSGAVVLDVHPFKETSPTPQSDMAVMQSPPDDDQSLDRPMSEPALPNIGGLSEFEMPILPQVFERPAETFGEIDLSSTTGQVSVELLGRALSRAASQGLVAADDAVPERERDTTLRELRRLEDRQNLSVTTSFDRATRADALSIPPTQNGGRCLEDDAVDVASWGEDANTHALGRLRGAAISEDGSVNPKGAAALARFYTYLGFGVEAEVAASYMVPSPSKEIIEALAEVLDSGRSDAPILQGQITCKGKVSLWSILAQPLDQSNAPISVAPALAAFSALPAHLRTHLGPLLSERLHAAGLHEEARTAINAVTRGGTRTEESELASARIELDGTHADAARDVLAELSNGTDLTAAAALLELLEDAEARGMAPNPAWVDDAPTLVGALEGTEIAERLNVAGMRGRIALGRFDDFRAALVEDAPGLTYESRRELASLALRALLDAGSDETFVTTEIGLSKIVAPANLPRPVRHGLAKRLHELGLSQRATAYLDATPETKEDLELAVRVRLAIGDVDAALALVDATSFDGVAGLRATSHVAAGNDSDAVMDFAAAGDQAGAALAAMRIAEWSWLAENGSAPVASATRQLITPIADAVTETETPNGALIEASRDRRESARALLDLTRPSAGAPNFTN